MAVMLIARFDGDVGQLRQAYDKGACADHEPRGRDWRRGTAPPLRDRRRSPVHHRRVGVAGARPCALGQRGVRGRADLGWLPVTKDCRYHHPGAARNRATALKQANVRGRRENRRPRTSRARGGVRHLLAAVAGIHPGLAAFSGARCISPQPACGYPSRAWTYPRCGRSTAVIRTWRKSDRVRLGPDGRATAAGQGPGEAAGLGLGQVPAGCLLGLVVSSA
jgi:hypothetical protein